MSFLFPACRCCGCLTRTKESEEYLCEVCGWLELSEEGNAAWAWMMPSLNDAIQNFESLGAVSGDYVTSVRAPRESEVPPEGWQPWAVRRVKLVESGLRQIYEAFAQVKLGRGIGLHDTRVYDDYWGFKPPQDYWDALPKDTAGHWRDTPPSLLEHYGEFFSFTDPEGFRYYLPAYLTASLRSLLAGPAFNHWRVANALAGPRSEWFDLLTIQQRAAVAAYLQAGGVLLMEGDAKSCAEALHGYWGKYLGAAAD